MTRMNATSSMVRTRLRSYKSFSMVSSKSLCCVSRAGIQKPLCTKQKLGTVGTTCKACGSQGQLDVTHRITQYIVKNPPEPDASTAKVKTKKGKKSKQCTDRNSDEDPDASVAGGDENSRHSPVNNADGDDDDWVEDTTEEAQLQRMSELSAVAKSLALSVDVDKSETERADVFFKHLLLLKQKGLVVEQRREVKQEAERLNLGPRAVLVVAEALLTSPSTILVDIKTYASVFVLFTRIGESAKRSQQYLLGATAKSIERFNKQDLLSKACHILKCLYDCDIVEEDVILAWYDKGPSRKFVSKELSAKILK
ncbi:Eukaryotic translation initiation factor 5 [Fasciolopsis buskii]|uniref:Eukaryotic translation initiation factor 5 n=1 Tax=Fasciolopsis buskii TaxID=27845 RepID=A0A8E0VFZ1_9TREM|nr:Eukaryotic translation initiation factor 5 [Fasciolopsis buski]